MRRSLIFSTAALVSALGLGCTDSPAPTGPGAPAAMEPASLKKAAAPTPQLLVTGLQELQGSTVGPGGALFVTAPLTGRIWRVDPKTGAVTLFADGLPARNPDPFFLGAGVIDVAFLGASAYALVTGVASDLEPGRDDVVGIYRVDGPSSFTIIADLGAFSLANPPAPDFFVPTGFQFAIEPFRGGFLVTDGHHNRVLRVTLDGQITEIIAFGNLVPTGLEVWGNTVYLAQAGPIPHVPETGKVVAFGPQAATATEVASGARLLVDVERGRGGTLFALAQGFWDGPFEGAPAQPETGALVRVNGDGTFTEVIGGLDRPTSLEIIKNTAYVVMIDGEIWTIDNIAGPPFGETASSNSAANGNRPEADR
jgi:sugar lactone lactonase YvrE